MSKKSASTTPTPTHDHAGHDHAAHTHTHADDSLISENSKVSVSIPWTTVTVAYQAALQKAARNVKAPGFRQGKVPPQVAEKLLDQSALFERTLQDILPAAYTEVLKKENKLPISRPEIEPVEMEKGKDWSFIVHFAERPTDIKIGDYKKIAQTALKDAEKEIKEVAEAAKKAETSKEKDAKPAEKPDAAKLEEQKDDIRLKHIFRALVEHAKPRIPELLIREEVEAETRKILEQLQPLNLTLDHYLEYRKMDREKLRQEQIITAVSTFQLEFVLAEIAKAEKITVEEKEIDEALDKIANGKLSTEQRQNTEYRSYLFSSLIKQKVIKFLLAA